MDTRFPFSPAEVAKVHMVQFGILSPDEIVILWPSFNLVIRAFFLFFSNWLERERERERRCEKRKLPPRNHVWVLCTYLFLIYCYKLIKIDRDGMEIDFSY
jgi:hypothetical protein